MAISTDVLESLRISPEEFESWRQRQREKVRSKSAAEEVSELREEVDRLRKVLVLLLEGNPEVKMAVDVLLGGIGEVPK